MENIIDQFETIYLPVKALLVFTSLEKDVERHYVEAYDMDKTTGQPVNAHPLSVQESAEIGEVLRSALGFTNAFLRPDGLMPKQVLTINPESDGYVIWHTPAFSANLYFTENLGIPCGMAALPSLIWKATRHQLHLFALKASTAPRLDTTLYHAPFFNINNEGAVCMGTVEVAIGENCSLELFMRSWQRYFLESYFSHLHGTIARCHNDNLVDLWKALIGTGQPFPVRKLSHSQKSLKDIL
jgi:PRTRC genetic system protein B